MTSTFTINVNLKHSIISLPITSHGNEPQPYHTLDCCSGQQPFGAFIHWTLETPYKASCVVTPGCCVTSAAGEEWHSPTSAAGEEWHSPTSAAGEEWHSPTSAAGEEWHSPTSAAGEEWHSPTSAAGEEWHSLTRPYCTVASHTSAWSNLMLR